MTSWSRVFRLRTKHLISREFTQSTNPESVCWRRALDSADIKLPTLAKIKCGGIESDSKPSKQAAHTIEFAHDEPRSPPLNQCIVRFHIEGIAQLSAHTVWSSICSCAVERI